MHTSTLCKPNTYKETHQGFGHRSAKGCHGLEKSLPTTRFCIAEQCHHTCNRTVGFRDWLVNVAKIIMGQSQANLIEYLPHNPLLDEVRKAESLPILHT